MRQLYLYALLIGASFAVYGQTSVPADSSQNSGAPLKFDPKTMRPPVPVNSPEANFPEKAPNLPGMCMVSLTVDANGRPKNPRIQFCSDQIFADNTIAAVMKYRFKPARTHEGNPIEAPISFQVMFHPPKGRHHDMGSEPSIQVRYGFSSPPGVASSDPDAEGIYSLSGAVQAPKMVDFVSREFSRKVVGYPDGASCTVVLVIDAKGKASYVKASSCNKPGVDKAAVDSLLHSKYDPATLNGNAVPVRTSINLVYDGYNPQKNPNEMH